MLLFILSSNLTALEITWDEEFGYPEVIDWNSGYRDLFNGSPYEVTLTIRNDGIDQVAVEGVEIQGEGAGVFRVDQDEFEPLEQGESLQFNIILEAVESDQYEAVIHVFSDDPDQGEIEIPLHAQTFNPPVIVVRPDEINIVPFENEELVITVTNEGEGLLRGMIEIEAAGELNWIVIDPQGFEIEQEGEEDFFLVWDAEGLIGGMYDAIIHFLSNDPVNPDVEVAVHLEVIAPDIDVEWAEEAGFPDEINWNDVFEDIFTDRQYSIPVTINNIGDAILIVFANECDNEVFIADPAGFEVEIGEEVVVEFIFEAEEAGLYEEVMIISSSDPDEDELEIRVVAEVTPPPEIVVEPNAIEFNLTEGEVDEHVLNVTNNGRGHLCFETEFRLFGDLNRDDPPDGRFLLLQESNPWGYDIERIFQVVRDLDYDRIRNWDQDFDLDEYDVVWIANYQSDNWNRAYMEHLEEIEDWVDNGGALYHCTGTNNDFLPTHPGGLQPVTQPRVNVAYTAASPEECYLFWLMEWEAGTLLRGATFNHEAYPQDRIDNIENSNGHRILVAHTRENGVPIVVRYNYGRGRCVVSGATDGYLHRNPHAYIWGQTGPAMLDYLSYLTYVNRWFHWEPRVGELDPGEDMDVIVTINAESLIDGLYLGVLTFLSNDPETPEVEVSVELEVTCGGLIWWNNLDPIRFEPAFVDIGEVEFPFRFQNVTGQAIEIEGYEVMGNNPDDFSTDVENGFIIPPYDDSEITFRFHPTGVGFRWAEILLFTDIEDLEDGVIWWEVSGLGQLPPIIWTDPDDRMGAVFGLHGDPAIQILTIGNAEGEFRDDLEFSITIEDVEEDRDRAVRSIRNVGPERNPMRDNRSNPDNMGYEWRDNLEDDGPEFEWIDIREFDNVRLFRLGDDVNTGRLILGWEFPFWNREHGQVYAHTDGWMSFTYGGRDIYAHAEQFPRGGIANCVAVFNDDNLAGTDIWYWTNEQDMAFIDWAGDHRFYFQLLLYGNGLGVMQYGQNINQNTGLVGVNLGDGQHGWYISSGRDNQYIIPGRAIAFGPANAWRTWATADPTEGILEAGEDMEIEITFDPEGLEEECNYFAELCIESNDPENPEVVIDLWLRTGVPDPEHFVDFEETETSHEIQINNLNFDDDPAPFGWEIGVFTPDDVLAGSVIWQGDCCVPLIAYGAAEGIDQFEAGDRFTFLVWDNEAEVEYHYWVEFEEGPEFWIDGARSVINLPSRRGDPGPLYLCEGWNMMSINIDPIQFYIEGEDRGPNIELMFEPIGPEEDMADLIILLKDGDGLFWAPEWDFINIPYWNLTEGYQIKLEEDVGYWIIGRPIPADADIPLHDGWNIAAYFPTYDLDAGAPDFYVLSPIIDHVLLAKDGAGRFMLPAHNFSNMLDWTEGQGYHIKIECDEPIVLNYPEWQEELSMVNRQLTIDNCRWTVPVSTGENMSVLMNSINGIELSKGDQIAAFNAEGLLVGTGTFKTQNSKLNIQNRSGLAIWGDDPTTEIKDGLIDGEAFTLRLWDNDRHEEITLSTGTVEAGCGLIYKRDGFTVLDVTVIEPVSEVFYLGQNYPNPFNSTTRYEFGLPEACEISVVVYDLNGRLVKSLVSEKLDAGRHVAVWNAGDIPAGVYMVRMDADGFNAVRKVMLVR